MTGGTSTSRTRRDEREDARVAAVRDAAIKHAPKHKRLNCSARGGRILSASPPELAIAQPSVIAAWVWNIRSNPNVTLRIRGGTFAGVARELEQPAELADARHTFCETVKLFDYGECATHRRGLPTRSKIKELHRYWFDTGIPLAIEFVE